MTVVGIADLLDEPPVHSGVSQEPAAPETSAAATTTTQVARQLKLSVTWGDITRVPADIHIAGHYEGVIPTSAERALDGKISSARRVIEEHTRQRWLVGALGEIAYFPASDAEDAGVTVRRVAVMGMGRPGTFTEVRATQMYASMLNELIGLDFVKRVAAVLIGSGAGNLTVQQAARAIVTGFTSAADKPTFPRSLEEVTLVEIDRLRAEQLLQALERNNPRNSPLEVEHSIAQVEGGLVSLEAAAVFAVCGLSRFVRMHEQGPAPPRRGKPRQDPLGALLDHVHEDLRPAVRQRLCELTDDPTTIDVVLGDPQQAAGDTPPVRISVVKGQDSEDGLRWAALTDRATIPERLHDLSPSLVKQLEDRLSPPTKEDADDLPGFLTRFVVPADFQPHITDQAPLVLEVDPKTARVPWEFLTDDADDKDEPLAVRTPVARQMRTSYASVVGEDVEGKELRALVIGDPGNPETHSLPKAREEARAVGELLRRFGFEVRLFLGTEPIAEAGVEPATQLDVLKELLGRRHYHLVHYAGHGTFDPDDARRTGWLFADGVLGARELSQLSRAPRLVFANACWTAARTDSPSDDPSLRSKLTPVLADEFLRVGVVHYIGTSWRIPEGLALLFAQTFYQSLLEDRMSVGDALRKGRHNVFWAARRLEVSGLDEALSAWGAYQHYGDPNDILEPIRRRDDDDAGEVREKPS